MCPFHFVTSFMIQDFNVNRYATKKTVAKVWFLLLVSPNYKLDTSSVPIYQLKISLVLSGCTKSFQNKYWKTKYYQGMLDIALLTANASQLKYVLQVKLISSLFCCIKMSARQHICCFWLKIFKSGWRGAPVLHCSSHPHRHQYYLPGPRLKPFFFGILYAKDFLSPGSGGHPLSSVGWSEHKRRKAPQVRHHPQQRRRCSHLHHHRPQCDHQHFWCSAEWYQLMSIRF